MDYDIYIDESGYTGVDFVNPDQPLFSLACNRLSHDKSDNLSSTVFSGDKESELKCSRLLGRSRENIGDVPLIHVDSRNVPLIHRCFSFQMCVHPRVQYRPNVTSLIDPIPRSQCEEIFQCFLPKGCQVTRVFSALDGIDHIL